jgi:ABC-type uncharacterized transport system involved in gliding motility auxiliary subunit
VNAMNKAVNLLGWLGSGAVAVSLFLRFQTAKPEWTPYSWHAAIAGLVLILLYLATQWRDVLGYFERRQTRLGTIAAGSVILVLGILVAVNYLASRRNHRWDLTAAKEFSLSEQTRQILEKLDAPVKVLVFAQPDDFNSYRDRLQEYQYVSNGKLTSEYIDPRKDPVRARANKVEAFGTLVFGYKGRTERVVGNDEQQFTNTLVKVLSGEQRKVYFLQGHGERDIASGDPDGYQVVVQGLGSENFKTETLPLAQKGEVPADASALVIAGPRTDLFQPEADAIRKYLDRGGKLFCMLEPPLKDQPPTPILLAVLKDWGFDVGENVVVDTNPIGQLLGTGELAPVVMQYPPHPIVAKFRGIATAYPTARSVKALSAPPNGRTPQTFLETTAAAWGETDIKAILDQKPIEANKDKDLMGPVPLGAALNVAAPTPPAPPAGKAPAADAPKPETRIVVVGDSDFASNNFLGIQGNRDMFLNIVNWLAQQENLISIRPKDPEDRRLTMSAAAQRNITWLSWLGIPAIVFGLGIVSWARRRG